MVKRLPGYSPDLAGRIVYPAASTRSVLNSAAPSFRNVPVRVSPCYPAEARRHLVSVSRGLTLRSLRRQGLHGGRQR